jgi:hypothetical protein
MNTTEKERFEKVREELTQAILSIRNKEDIYETMEHLAVALMWVSDQAFDNQIKLRTMGTEKYLEDKGNRTLGTSMISGSTLTS